MQKKEENMNEWFNELIRETELVDDRYNVKGFVIYREWCAMSLKKMYNIFESVLNKKNHMPLFMPVVIPEQNFYKEAEHVKGFTPEVFWVTEHGDKEKLEEKLALRPTSETAFYQMYSLWIRSYNDLPYKRYQSGSVYRYETKATRPFLRGREFLWIETHCAFRDEKAALEQIQEDMETTKEVITNVFGIPVLFLQRPQWDKFAGAVNTYAADTITQNGKFLQTATTHYLGTSFAKAFDVKYKDENGKDNLAHLTCYGPGISREFGTIVAIHGDNKGLRFPFEIAPKQIVIVPVLIKGKEKEVLKKVKDIYKKLSKTYEVILDDNTQKTPGEKFYFWEMKGVPIRIEIGPRDIENKKVGIFRRDLNSKEFILEKDLTKTISKIAKEFTSNLKNQAEKAFTENIVEVKDMKALEKALESNKVVRAPFCSIDKDGEKYADMIKEKTGAEIKGIILTKETAPKELCIASGKPAKHYVYIGRGY
ncbi:MAG: proline--tRNA ligase [Candidatus ainarchaeum sp.]|nr:proline--tRNA ligase [Candidatus ainarchaeum sp.]